MLNRTLAPNFKTIDRVEYPTVKESQIGNGIKVFCLYAQTPEVIKIELIFSIGKDRFEKVIPGFFSSGLLSGTATKSAEETEELFSRYGGFTEIENNASNTRIKVYGLPKFFEKYIDALSEVLKEASYPKDKFEISRRIGLNNWDQQAKSQDPYQVQSLMHIYLA